MPFDAWETGVCRTTSAGLRVIAGATCDMLCLLYTTMRHDLTSTPPRRYIPLIVFSVLFHVLRYARLCHSAKTGKRVRIPRCRATVSEDNCSRHWEKTREGWLQNSDGNILTRKARRPAPTVQPQP